MSGFFLGYQIWSKIDEKKADIYLFVWGNNLFFRVHRSSPTRKMHFFFLKWKIVEKIWKIEIGFAFWQKSNKKSICREQTFCKVTFQVLNLFVKENFQKKLKFQSRRQDRQTQNNQTCLVTRTKTQSLPFFLKRVLSVFYVTYVLLSRGKMLDSKLTFLKEVWKMKTKYLKNTINHQCRG